MKTAQKIQIIEKHITSAGQRVRFSDSLDSDYAYLKGIAVLWTAGKGHLLNSCTIDGCELFPKDFEVAFLQSNTYIAPAERFYPLSEKADGKTIEFDFQDGGLRDRSAYPYTLKIYLLLTNEKETNHKTL